MSAFLTKIKAKIFTWNLLEEQVEEWKANGETIVFTNGCFDILHYGHLHYLSEARSLGQHLIVGINSAASVKRLKGPHRPINDEATRLHLLAALLCIDALVVFEEDTPLKLIELVVPDILVKGGDWQAHQIVGSDIVLANGGKVMSLPFIEGYSTTNIEQKIKNS